MSINFQKVVSMMVCIQTQYYIPISFWAKFLLLGAHGLYIILNSTNLSEINYNKLKCLTRKDKY